MTQSPIKEAARDYVRLMLARHLSGRYSTSFPGLTRDEHKEAVQDGLAALMARDDIVDDLVAGALAPREPKQTYEPKEVYAHAAA